MQKKKYLDFRWVGGRFGEEGSKGRNKTTPNANGWEKKKKHQQHQQQLCVPRPTSVPSSPGVESYWPFCLLPSFASFIYLRFSFDFWLHYQIFYIIRVN